MVQHSFIRGQSRNRGAKRTIKIPVITANTFKQYGRNDDKLKSVNRKYGCFNAINIMNNDAVDIEVVLDFVASKTYPVPAKGVVSVSEVIFQEFNVVNLDAATDTTINKITITPMFEYPLEKEGVK